MAKGIPRFKLGSPYRRHAHLAWIASGTTALVLAACTGLFFCLAQSTDSPTHADAIFVLAPTHGRITYAEELMDQGYGSTLAISVPRHEHGSKDYAPCAEKRAYRIVCFQPDPVTTQGEARALQRLTALYGWNSVSVVSDESHLPRARILMSRCYKGDLRMVAYQKNLPFVSLTDIGKSWMFVSVYETAAFVKVALNQDC